VVAKDEGHLMDGLPQFPEWRPPDNPGTSSQTKSSDAVSDVPGPPDPVPATATPVPSTPIPVPALAVAAGPIAGEPEPPAP
jgi:hypothetical protein